MIVWVLLVESPESDPKDTFAATARVAIRVKEGKDFRVIRQMLFTAISFVTKSDIKLEEQIESNERTEDQQKTIEAKHI